MHSKNAQSCYPSDTQFVKEPLEFVLVVTWYIVYGINFHLRPSDLLFSFLFILIHHLDAIQQTKLKHALDMNHLDMV